MKSKLLLKRIVKLSRTLLSIVLLILLVPLLYVLISIDNIKSGIIDYIENQGKQYELLVGDVSLNPLNSSVKNLSLLYNQNSIKIEKIGVVPNYYNIFKYLIDRDSTLSFIDSLYIDGIDLKVNLYKKNKDNSKKREKNNIDKMLKKFKKISLYRTDVSVFKNGKELLNVNNIKGELYNQINSKYRFRFNVQGYYKKNKNAIKIDLLTNNFNKDYEIRAQFNDLNIKDTLSFKLFKDLTINGGNLDGKLIAFINRNGVSADGILNVTDVDWSIGKVKFDNTYANVRFEQDTVFLDKMVLKKGFNSVLINGKYSFDNHYDFIAMESGSRLQTHFGLDLLDSLKYTPNGDLTYIVEAKDGVIKSNFLINNFMLDSIVGFNKITGDLIYKKGKFDINYLNLIDNNHSKIKVFGKLSKNEKILSINGNLDSKKIRFNSNNYIIKLNKIVGKYKDGDMNFSTDIKRVKINNRVVNNRRMLLNLAKKDDKLKVTVGNQLLISSKKSVVGNHFNGYVKNSFVNYFLPQIKQLSGKSSFSGFFSTKKKFNIQITSGGSYKKVRFVSRLNTKGYFFNKDSNQININNNLKIGIGKNRFNVINHINLYNRLLKFNIVNLDSSIFINGELSNIFNKKKREIRFKSKINNSKLDFLLKNDSHFKGVAVGEIIGSGLLSDIQIQSFLTLYNIYYKDIGPLKMNLSLKYLNNRLVNSEPIVVSYKKYALLNIEKFSYDSLFFVNIHRDSLNLDVINKIANISGLSGKMGYNVDVRADRKLKNLKSDYKIYIFNAMYDDYSIKSANIDGKLNDMVLDINSCLVNLPDLNIKARGNLPLIKDRNKSMNFSLLFDGELIKEATKKVKFITNVSGEKSSGKVNVNFEDGNVVVYGDIHSEVNLINLKDVIPKIDNSIIDIKFRKNRLIYNSKSLVHGRVVKLFNYFDSHDSNNFKIGNFDLGKLGVDADKRGIKFHFTKFQNDIDKGNAKFLGKGMYRYFTLAGPLPDINLIGTIKLFDTQFSFPIDRANKNKKRNLYAEKHFGLDLDIIAGNRTSYYFQVNNYFRGQKIVDVYLDEGSKLTVKGKVNKYDLRLFGDLTSTNRGKLYLGRYFKTENLEAEFIPLVRKDKTVNNIPVLSGKAYIMDKDENNMSKKIEVILKIRENGENFYKTRGRPGEIKFDATASGYIDEKEYNNLQKEFLSKIFGVDISGNSVTKSSLDLTKKAVEVGENYLMDRYVNGMINRYLQIPYLDVVKVNSNVLSNFYFNQLNEINSNLELIRGSSFEFGSFISDKMFLNYQGTVDINAQNNLYLKHTLGLEYSLNPMVQFKFDVNYDPTLNLSTPYKSYGLQLNIPFTILEKRK